jgi:hypothetical protein
MLKEEPCTIDSAELEQLIRLASGLPPREAQRGARRSNAPIAEGQGAKAAHLVRLSIDLLLTTRQSGLSPTESGCFFLLLAAHLLNDMPSETIAAMIEQIRRRPSASQT